MTSDFQMRLGGAALSATLLLGAGAACAAPQKVFRCGPDGRIYSQVPCKDGYEVGADDKRSAEQRKAGDNGEQQGAKMSSESHGRHRV